MDNINAELRVGKGTEAQLWGAMVGASRLVAKAVTNLQLMRALLAGASALKAERLFQNRFFPYVLGGLSAAAAGSE